MITIRNFTLAVVATTVVMGCTTLDTVEVHDNVRSKIKEDLVDVIAKRDYITPTPLVRRFDRVYVDNLTKDDVEKPDWYTTIKGVSATSGLSLLNFLQQTFDGIPVNFQFLEGVDRDITFQVADLKGYSYAEILDHVSSLSGYSYTVQGRNVVFKNFENKTFPIRHLPGVESYAVGKKGMRSSGGQDSSGSGTKKTGDFIGGSDQEFSVLEGSIDVLGDVKLGIDTILGCYANKEVKAMEGPQDILTSLDTSEASEENGCAKGARAQVLRSSSSIFVRAIPSQMRDVEAFIKTKNALYTRQVSVQISLINVEFTDENQFNVDFNLVTESVSKGLIATAKTTASSGILGGLDPRGVFSLASTSGSHAGSELYLEALSHQGAVTKKTFPRVIVTNNHVGVVGNIDRVNYISGRETLTTASVGASNSIVQSEAETGFLLYTLPNIGENDAILRLSTSQSALLDLETKGEGDQLVESPVINDKLFNTTIRVDYNKPVLIAGLSATLSQANGSESGILPTGISRSSKEKAIETILMIEVVRL
jgi:hypothetical protein